MQALGFIETKGLVVAIESADAMLKAAEVTLVDKTLVGGGLVSITVTGDVGAVKAAVEAGAAAVCKLDGSLLISQHVIPRPHQEVDGVMFPKKLIASELLEEETFLEDAETKTVEVVFTETPKGELPTEEVLETKVETENKEEETTGDSSVLTKNAVDEMVKAQGVKKAMEFLSGLKVVKLRNLAREYKDFGISGRLVSKADKKILMQEFNSYYTKK